MSVSYTHLDVYKRQALPLAEALVAGGIGCIEITLRTAAGLPSIKAIAASNVPLMVGVGTVTRAEQVLSLIHISQASRTGKSGTVRAARS